MHGQRNSPPPALEEYLQQLFLFGPWCDADAPSLVYVDARGRVIGFLGVIVRPMRLENRRLRAAFGSGFIVHPDSRTTPAGLQLVRAFFSGNQDLSLSDTANPISQTIWSGFGGTLVPSFGMHWSRPLRLSSYALYAFSRRSEGVWSRQFARLSRPVCKLVDAFAARIPLRPFHLTAPVASAEPLDIDTLLDCLSDSWGAHSVKPVYEKNSLSWLLDFMSQMKAYGDVHKVALRNKERKVIGCYIYCMRDDGIAEVVQICGKDRGIGSVIDHLFHDAWAHGAIGVHGKLETRIADVLSKKYCFFYHGKDPLLVHSRDPELVRLFQNGDAYFTRLDGEWCLRFGSESMWDGAANQRVAQPAFNRNSQQHLTGTQSLPIRRHEERTTVDF